MSTPPQLPENATQWETTREVLINAIDQVDGLEELGYTRGDIFPADTVDSPERKPFIVVRWGDQEDRVGDAWVHPVSVWFYDKFGDYSRVDKMANLVGKTLQDHLFDIKTMDGRLSQVKNRGLGGDLADDGFDALVRPLTLGVSGRGI